jgi:PqqD family protein of HPr-rel-A system
MVWSLIAPGQLRFRSWDEEGLAVVYNTASGDTHLIESPGIEILQLLQASPHTVNGLAHAMQAMQPVSEPCDLAPYVTQTLQQLMAIGLVSDTSP